MSSLRKAFAREKDEAMRLVRRSAGLPPKSSALMSLILDHSNFDLDGRCWLSVGRMASELQTTGRTIQRTIDALERSGLLVVHVRGGGRNSNFHFVRNVAELFGDVTSVSPHGDDKKYDERCHPCPKRGDTSVTKSPLETSLISGGTPTGSPLSAAASSKVVGGNLSCDGTDVEPAPIAALEAAGAFRRDDSSEIESAASPAYSDAMGSLASTKVPPPAPSAASTYFDLPSDDTYLAVSDLDEDEELSIEERIANLEEEIEHAISVNEMRLPAELAHFADRQINPDEAELARLEEMVRDAYDEDRMELHSVEQADIAPRQAEAPLADRINDPVDRASYIDRMVAHLLSLGPDARRVSSCINSAKIVAGPNTTLPRFRAEALAQELADEVLTAVWTQERGQAVDVIPALAIRAYPISSPPLAAGGKIHV